MKTRRNFLFLAGAGALGSLPVSAFAAGTIRSRGKNYTPLHYVRARYSMSLSESGQNIHLRNRWHTLDFEPNGRRCRINGTLIWLNHPLRKIGVQWALQDPDFSKSVDPCLRSGAFLRRVRRQIVVLDPGHGGRDSGVISPRNVHEKLLVMAVSRIVRDHLQSQGIRVHLTREQDVYVSLAERCRKAEAWRADLFVSIHANSAGSNPGPRGPETFILSIPGSYSTGSYGRGTPSSTVHPGNRHNVLNTILGFRLQQHMVRATGHPDRGLKRARFEVLRGAPCPAALAETVFLTNPEEEAMAITPAGRERIARGISNGILTYIRDSG